jgi:RNA polymerase sigma-70 factor (ECF subfamily)
MMLPEQLAAMRPMLVRFADQRLPSRSQAEDAVQDALMAVLEHPERYAGRSSLRTYVIGILKFKIIDSLRGVYQDRPADDIEEPEQSPAPGLDSEPLRLLQQAQFMEVVNRGLDKLSSNARHAFVLREYDDLDTAELCEQLAVTASNAWVLLHRARTGLREHLRTHWIEAR